jgi:hypothetical protein
MPHPDLRPWANPIESYFVPLRQFTPANSNHPHHTARTRALHAYGRRRSTNARHPDALAARRRAGSWDAPFLWARLPRVCGCRGLRSGCTASACGSGATVKAPSAPSGHSTASSVTYESKAFAVHLTVTVPSSLGAPPIGHPHVPDLGEV